MRGWGGLTSNKRDFDVVDPVRKVHPFTPIHEEPPRGPADAYALGPVGRDRFSAPLAHAWRGRERRSTRDADRQVFLVDALVICRAVGLGGENRRFACSQCSNRGSMGFIPFIMCFVCTRAFVNFDYSISHSCFVFFANHFFNGRMRFCMSMLLDSKLSQSTTSCSQSSTSSSWFVQKVIKMVVFQFPRS